MILILCQITLKYQNPINFSDDQSCKPLQLNWQLIYEMSCQIFGIVDLYRVQTGDTCQKYH